MALHGTLLPTISLLWQLFVYSVLPGRGLSSYGLQHSQHSLASTVHKVLEMEYDITIRFFANKLTEMLQRHKQLPYQKAPKKCSKLHKIDFVQLGITRINWHTQSLVRMSTLARQHHLVAGMNTAVCGQFVATNTTEIKNKIKAIPCKHCLSKMSLVMEKTKHATYSSGFWKSPSMFSSHWTCKVLKCEAIFVSLKLNYVDIYSNSQ